MFVLRKSDFLERGTLIKKREKGFICGKSEAEGRIPDDFDNIRTRNVRYSVSLPVTEVAR